MRDGRHVCTRGTLCAGGAGALTRREECWLPWSAWQWSRLHLASNGPSQYARAKRKIRSAQREGSAATKGRVQSCPTQKDLGVTGGATVKLGGKVRRAWPG